MARYERGLGASLRAEVSAALDRLMRAWRMALAYMHWSDAAVCRMSRSRGVIDFHDACDSNDPRLPWGTLRCRRCGKEFWL